MNKKELGIEYENLAVKFLLNIGYKILQKNYRTLFGEIDIIAYDKKEDCLVFIEVRYRKNSSYGTPQETVNYYKQNKIAKAALIYSKTYMKGKKCNYRFDIISISENNKIEHIKNAFYMPIKGVY